MYKTFFCCVGLWSTTCFVSAQTLPDTVALTANERFAAAERALQKGQMADALALHQQCLAIRGRILSAGDTLLAMSYRQTGRAFAELGRREEALEYLEKALAIAEGQWPATHLFFPETLDLISQCQLYLGDFEGAIATAQRALLISKKQKSDPAQANILYTLGMCYKNLHRYPEAIQHYQAVLALRSAPELGENAGGAGVYSELGEVYLEVREYEKALDCFQKSHDIMVRIGAAAHRDFAYVCYDMAQAEMALNNAPAAIQWYLQTLQILQNAYKGPSSEGARVRVALGHAYLQSNQLAEAQKAFETARQQWSDLFGPDHVKNHLADNGLALCDLYQYRHSGDTSFLAAGRQHLHRAREAIFRLLKYENSSVVRRKWLSDTRMIFENALAIETAYPPGVHLENAWHWSEMMHAYTLLAATQDQLARSAAGIPAAWQEEETHLSRQRADLEKKRRICIERERRTMTDSAVLALDVAIFQIKTAHEQWIDRLEQEFPLYHQLKFQLQPTDIQATRDRLAPRQTLLEYFVGDSRLYVFVLRSDTAFVCDLPRPPQLSEWIRQYRAGITGYYAPEEGVSAADYETSIRQYAMAARRLYDCLLSPLKNHLSETLLIVPDAELYGLPFEALLSDSPKDIANFKTYPFLVRTCEIGYLYAASLWKQRPAPSAEGAFLGFAPFSRDSLSVGGISSVQARDHFGGLPWSGVEIRRAQQAMGVPSRIFSGADATLEQWKRCAPDYRVLHLATHARADVRTGESSFLVFAGAEPERCYAGDLYALRLRADLVVLSACETGWGAPDRSDGMLSLARAFSVAGARCVLMSLWKVNDRSSMQVMERFYNQYGKGVPVTRALTAARRQYLLDFPGQMSHPFFWAGWGVNGE